MKKLTNKSIVNRMQKKLSDKPSEMLIQAYSDFLLIEEDPRYKIDMTHWHSSVSGTECSVCLAGSTIAASVKNPEWNIYDCHEEEESFWDYIVSATGFTKDLKLKLFALDSIRRGSILQFLSYMQVKREKIESMLMGVDGEWADNCSNFTEQLPSYHYSKENFKAWIEGWIGILQAEGL